MSQRRLFIPVGIPGCGKSTWARAMGLRTISTDDIRREVSGSLVEYHKSKGPGSEDFVFSKFHTSLHNMLGRESVIADATNLTKRSRETLRYLAENKQVDSHLIVFTNIDDAVERNKGRNADLVVPDEAMERMVDQFKKFIADDFPVEYDLYRSVMVVSNYSTPLSEPTNGS